MGQVFLLQHFLPLIFKPSQTLPLEAWRCHLNKVVQLVSLSRYNSRCVLLLGIDGGEPPLSAGCLQLLLRVHFLHFLVDLETLSGVKVGKLLALHVHFVNNVLRTVSMHAVVGSKVNFCVHHWELLLLLLWPHQLRVRRLPWVVKRPRHRISSLVQVLVLPNVSIIDGGHLLHLLLLG